MSLRKTSLPSRVLPERLVEQVDVHRPRERVRDHERRRREVVHLHVGVDPALEVAVARQHRDDREVLRVDDVGDLLRQRPRVPDAGRAAVADEVEAELLERLDQAGLVVVLHDDLRARGERRLDPRLRRQPARDGVARQQARADHHRRVRRVRARRDRGDDHVAVVELGLGAVGRASAGRSRRRGRRPARRPSRRRRARAGGRGTSRRSWPAGRRRGTTPRTPRRPRCGPARRGPRAPAGTSPWTRSARRGPAGASGRRATGRRRRGRARASRSRSPPRRPRRATCPGRGRTSRRARAPRASGRRTRGSAASRRRSGRSRTSSRTPATCCRSSPGRRAGGSPTPAP